MKFIFLLTYLGIVFAPGVARAVQAATLIATHGETVLSATAPKLTVRITFQTHEAQIGKPSDSRPSVTKSNCTYSMYPCSIVDHIGIAVNGKLLFVPRSIFCALADLSHANISADDKGSVLTLWGGNASEAYIVKIKFDATGVKSRTESSALLPDEPSEESTYNVHTIGD